MLLITTTNTVLSQCLRENISFAKFETKVLLNILYRIWFKHLLNYMVRGNVQVMSHREIRNFGVIILQLNVASLPSKPQQRSY